MEKRFGRRAMELVAIVASCLVDLVAYAAGFSSYPNITPPTPNSNNTIVSDYGLGSGHERGITDWLVDGQGSSWPSSCKGTCSSTYCDSFGLLNAPFVRWSQESTKFRIYRAGIGGDGQNQGVSKDASTFTSSGCASSPEDSIGCYIIQGKSSDKGWLKVEDAHARKLGCSNEQTIFAWVKMEDFDGNPSNGNDYGCPPGKVRGVYHQPHSYNNQSVFLAACNRWNPIPKPIPNYHISGDATNKGAFFGYNHSGGSCKVQLGTNLMDDNNWHSIAGVIRQYASTGWIVELYVDGDMKANQDCGNSPPLLNAGIMLLASNYNNYNDAGTGKLQGWIDEVLAFPRALSEGQIAELHNPSGQNGHALENIVPGTFKKNSKIKVCVTAHDKDSNPATDGDTKCSTEKTVGNGAPIVEVAHILPAAPDPLDPLSADVLYIDRDGDSGTINCQWSVNGTSQGPLQSHAANDGNFKNFTFKCAGCSPGALAKVTCYGNDGTANGTADSKQANY